MLCPVPWFHLVLFIADHTQFHNYDNNYFKSLIVVFHSVLIVIQNPFRFVFKWFPFIYEVLRYYVCSQQVHICPLLVRHKFAHPMFIVYVLENCSGWTNDERKIVPKRICPGTIYFFTVWLVLLIQQSNGQFHNCQSWSFITVHGQF